MAHKRRHRKQAPGPCPAREKLLDYDAAQKRLEWVFMGVLLSIGIYLSVVYFGQKAVPNSDFTAFVQTGKEILHFQMPSSFKRVPVLGILQIAFGKLMFASPHPTLTGGLVLNGVLYTLSIILLYKVARFFVKPTGSFCLGLIAALNPYALAMVVDPIAETAIVFFILLTVYLILKRSWWCYAAGMLASMTRYECFLLIGAALLFDLVTRQGAREKLKAIGAATAASIPMALWLIGTQVTTTSAEQHYFKHFLDVEHRNGFKLLELLWQTTFRPLAQWPQWVTAVFVQQPTDAAWAEAIVRRYQTFSIAWNIVTAGFFVLGSVWAVVKKQWPLLGAIVVFWGLYVLVHMSQRVLIDRYTLPVVWLTLLLATYGLVCSLRWLAGHLPRAAVAALCIVAAVIALVWTLQLAPAIPSTDAVSPASATVVYAGLAAAAIALAIKQRLYRTTTLLPDVCLLCGIGLMVVSNQFSLAMRLGHGTEDIEFRKLAEWHLAHAEEGQRLATTMPGVVNLFLPEAYRHAVHTSWIPGENLAEFAESCRRQAIRYVAWDSRLGMAVNDEYYKSWGLKKIHPLGSGRDIGPFRFAEKIEATPRRFIYVYRVDFQNDPQP